jgi:hypothetical protein
MKISILTLLAPLLLASMACSAGAGQSNAGSVRDGDDAPTTGQFPKRSNQPAPNIGSGAGDVPTNTTDYAPLTGNERPSPLVCEGTWKCETNGSDKAITSAPKLVGRSCAFTTIELLPNGRARTEKLGLTGTWTAYGGVPTITFGALVFTCTATTGKAESPSK